MVIEYHSNCRRDKSLRLWGKDVTRERLNIEKTKNLIGRRPIILLGISASSL